MCSNPIILASTCPKFKIKESFEKLRTWTDGQTDVGGCRVRWVKIPESFPTSIRGFSGSNDEDILWNFPNWFIRNLRNGVLFYRQLQADCLYHINCLYNFPAYTWRQKRNAFPGLCNGSIFMIQKNLIIISGTEPRFLCWEIKLTVSYIDNSSYCTMFWMWRIQSQLHWLWKIQSTIPLFLQLMTAYLQILQIYPCSLDQMLVF